jgi:hypothetical protein
MKQGKRGPACTILPGEEVRVFLLEKTSEFRTIVPNFRIANQTIKLMTPLTGQSARSNWRAPARAAGIYS